MSIVLLSLAALFAAPPVAVARDRPPPAPDADVVVTGQRNRDRAQAARSLVDALAVPTRYRQLARLEDGVCPKAFGFGTADNAGIEARIRRIAVVAGAPKAAASCKANVVLLVVSDKAAAIRHWRVARPDFFDGLDQREIIALADAPGPVAAWQIVRMKGAGRRPIAKSESDTFDYYVVDQATPYRIGSQVQFEFRASFVVVEAKALSRASQIQIADYAAMRTLAATDPNRVERQALPTILSLIDRGGDVAPLSVTRWDIGFLKALYDIPIAARAHDQRRAMARSLATGERADANK